MAAIAELKGELDLKRKAFIVAGSVHDLEDKCIIVKDPDFDVEKSIFGHMDDKYKKWYKDQTTKPMWSDRAVLEISSQFEQIPPPVPESTELLEFMRFECDFLLEHQDGSFMDHLTFCRDYCAHHYKSQSSTPLFIHSIFGVGTNIFPMEKEKIPMLAKILSPADFVQTEAFPSILRLVNSYAIQDALNSSPHPLEKLQGITFHRCIDNKPLRLTAEELWVQLNFQLIHTMDFLPVADWSKNAGNGQLQVFARTLDLLMRAGRLEAGVAWDAKDSGVTLRDVLEGKAADSLQQRKGMAWFQKDRSKRIGHSLDFNLEWASSL